MADFQRLVDTETVGESQIVPRNRGLRDGFELTVQAEKRTVNRGTSL